MIDVPVFYNNKRISSGNVKDYLLRKFPQFDKIQSVKSSTIIMDNLLQKNYGKDNDCSLTSITECVMYHYMKNKNSYTIEKELNAEEVYDTVEQIADKYFYNGDNYGTIPVFIKNIYDETLQHYKINYKTKQKYFKNIGYSLSKIKELVDRKIPVIWSIFKDGRDYYNSHTITVKGYQEFELTNSTTGTKKHVTMLIIQDHWSKVISYVDFDFISCISAINY